MTATPMPKRRPTGALAVFCLLLSTILTIAECDALAVPTSDERKNPRERRSIARRRLRRSLLVRHLGHDDALDLLRALGDDEDPLALDTSIEEEEKLDEEEWKQLSHEFTSGVRKYDDAYELARDEMRQNIVDDQFIAGSGWTTLWTRDTSYAMELAAGLIHPEISNESIRKCVETDEGGLGEVWLQDECGHFGGWPNLSDAIVGARAAWSFYSIYLDVEMLDWAYNVTKNSLLRAERDAFDPDSGLFKGCSSFMESNSGYPVKYHSDGELVGKTKALSTNMLYYSGYKIAALMGKELKGHGLKASDDDIQYHDTMATLLRDKIQSRLWLDGNGYYSYFEDEDGQPVENMEGLGEALALLAIDFETDPNRIDKIFDNVYRTENGIPCLWPKFPIDEKSHKKKQTEWYYHNGRIWPFVQGYWAVAAARHGKIDVFDEELSNLLRLSREHDTFAEFYNAEDMSIDDDRKRQLWSDAGFLAMIHLGLFGMNFTPEGIEFRPVKPATPFYDAICLESVPYREMMLHVYVRGHGMHIKMFKFDGMAKPRAFVDGSLKGDHTVVIMLDDSTDS